MKKMISLILALVMSLALCAPAFAVEGEISIDSASDVEIVYNAEEAERLESDITRDDRAPREYHDLSKEPWYVDGTFEVSIYSARYFKPNANGKINYHVTVEFLEEFPEYPLLPTMTVECCDRTTKRQVTETTFESKIDVWPFVPRIDSGDRTISGLNTDHEYYFVFRKDIYGVDASVIGTISH